MPCHRTRWQLDEEATATARADTGIWRLVHKPLRERWFDLHLVVELGASMALWQPDIDAFVRGLKGQGGFRSLQRWTLAGAADFGLRACDGRAASPTALQLPGQRPLVAVASSSRSTPTSAVRLGTFRKTGLRGADLTISTHQ